MQSHERIRVVPVAAGAVMAVYDHHAGIGFVKQGVSERHTDGTAADDEVIGF